MFLDKFYQKRVSPKWMCSIKWYLMSYIDRLPWYYSLLSAIQAPRHSTQHWHFCCCSEQTIPHQLWAVCYLFSFRFRTSSILKVEKKRKRQTSQKEIGSAQYLGYLKGTLSSSWKAVILMRIDTLQIKRGQTFSVSLLFVGWNWYQVIVLYLAIFFILSSTFALTSFRLWKPQFGLLRLST